jgi:hypothetical protein
MIFDQFQRMLHQLAETQRKAGVSTRMGTVKEVKQDGGEQKIRCVIGVDPDGKELVGPWMSTVDKRGATREQHQYKKGQNVRISGADGDFRQATASGWSEGDSFPQPDSAPEHGYGDSYQAGKLHTGQWLPEDDDQQQGGGGAGPQSAGGGGQGGGQGGEDKNHRHEVWIAKEDNKPPKHSGVSGIKQQTSGQPAQQQQQQKKEQKKLEEAVMVSTDEKNGFTGRVGKDVRVAAHPEGAKTRAGDTYFSAKKDDDYVIRSKKNGYNRVKEDFYYFAEDGIPFINKPWVIKEKKKDDEVPNDDQLGNKKGGKK